jgi:hypothetical protein
LNASSISRKIYDFLSNRAYIHLAYAFVGGLRLFRQALPAETTSLFDELGIALAFRFSIPGSQVTQW